MWVYVHVYLCVYRHMCVDVHAQGCSRLWRPKVDRAQPSLQVPLINCGRLSQSNTELINVASLTVSASKAGL